MFQLLRGTVWDPINQFNHGILLRLSQAGHGFQSYIPFPGLFMLKIITSIHTYTDTYLLWGRHCSVVGFTTIQSMPITSKAVKSNPAHVEVYSMEHHVIKFV